MIRLAMCAALVTALGCATKAEDDPAPAQSPPIDSRTVLDLARALDAVETGDPYDADLGFDQVRASFEGRRFRWTLYLVPSLCRAEQCNALPFTGAGRHLGVAQGWLPRLEPTAAQREQLMATCSADAAPCPFTVEARLARLEASPDDFTSVLLSDIQLRSDRVSQNSGMSRRTSFK